MFNAIDTAYNNDVLKALKTEELASTAHMNWWDHVLPMSPDLSNAKGNGRIFPTCGLTESAMVKFASSKTSKPGKAATKTNI